MMKKQYRLCCVLACGLMLFWGASVVQAGEETVEGSGTVTQEVAAEGSDPAVQEAQGATVDQEANEAQEASDYQNSAQEAHEKNLAEAAAEKINAEIDALEEEQAKHAVGSVEYDELQDELDAKRDELSEIEDEGKIAEMRASGMGWGEIAHELGVHPGVLGLGHTKTKDKSQKSPSEPLDDEAEVAAATAMDLSSGQAKGHGSDNGKGHASGTSNNGHAGGKGNGGAHGNDKGGGNGNGGGNGGGGGNGKK